MAPAAENPVSVPPVTSAEQATHHHEARTVELPAPTDPETGQPRSVCPACSAVMADPTSLERHMTAHHYPKPLTRLNRAVSKSKVVRALHWPFKSRPAHALT
ncbi:hypothetical protein JCM11641_005725 [Rhodosporidiobolus odoratus]